LSNIRSANLKLKRREIRKYFFFGFSEKGSLKMNGIKPDTYLNYNFNKFSKCFQ
jgi:hypothetical protein